MSPSMGILLIPIVFIGQLFLWYCVLYCIVWLINKMNGNPRPMFLLWRKRPVHTPVDDFRKATQKIIDYGWTAKEIVALLKEEFDKRG